MSSFLQVSQVIAKNQKYFRGHTDLNHGPIGLQPIALPLSYIPMTFQCLTVCCLSLDFCIAQVT